MWIYAHFVTRRARRAQWTGNEEDNSIVAYLSRWIYSIFSCDMHDVCELQGTQSYRRINNGPFSIFRFKIFAKSIDSDRNQNVALRNRKLRGKWTVDVQCSHLWTATHSNSMWIIYEFSILFHQLLNAIDVSSFDDPFSLSFLFDSCERCTRHATISRFMAWKKRSSDVGVMRAWRDWRQRHTHTDPGGHICLLTTCKRILKFRQR